MKRCGVILVVLLFLLVGCGPNVAFYTYQKHSLTGEGQQAPPPAASIERVNRLDPLCVDRANALAKKYRSKHRASAFWNTTLSLVTGLGLGYAAVSGVEPLASAVDNPALTVVSGIFGAAGSLLKPLAPDPSEARELGRQHQVLVDELLAARASRDLHAKQASLESCVFGHSSFVVGPMVRAEGS